MAWERERSEAASGAPAEGTIHRAIYEYKQSADFKAISEKSQRHYSYHLELFAKDFGHLMIRAIDYGWVDKHRTKMYDADRAITWNEIRKVMVQVTDRFINTHPLVIPFNPWQRVKRLRIEINEDERQNRPWPPEVTVQVFRHATPAFRRLLMVYIFTGQRGGDVVRMGDSEVEYDAANRVLIFTQQKTGKKMHLPVPAILHSTLARVDGESALLTPRGCKWNTLNAQETLRTLLRNLGLPRYTLHGLRSTVAATLGEAGFNELVLMAQGGWDDSRTVRQYLKGAQQKRMLEGVAEKLEEAFEPLIREAEVGANERRFAGVTGRAAAKAGLRVGRVIATKSRA